MSILTLYVDEVMRTLSSDGQYPFVENDKTVDIVRFALNTGFTDVVLDEHSALRVMYQRPGESQVRAQTLTYYDTDGLRNYYDWQLLSADLTKKGTLTVALCILRTDSTVEEWHTTPCQIRVLDTIHTDDSDEGDETITPTVAQRVAVLETMIQRVASGAPIVVASTSAMTDTSQIYVLSTDGKWYYHNGTAWTAGGTYGAVATDTTLSQSGAPADAKAAGDKLTNLKADFNDLEETVLIESSFNPSYQQGWIRSDGSLGNANELCRTGYLNLGSSKVIITPKAGYKIKVAEYNEINDSSTFARFIVGYTPEATPARFDSIGGKYYVIQISSVDGTAVTTSNIPVDAITISYVTFTDKTLLISDKAADAKAVGDKIAELKSALTLSIDYLANSEQMRVYPAWENGGIDSETGDDVVSVNSVRSGYIDKNAVAKWNIETHTGPLYVHRYNYADGVYTYLGRNQRTNTGDFTNWLKSLAGTHLRFENGQRDTSYPNTYMTLCYSTQIGKDIESLKATQTKTETIESNLGYWRQYLEIPAGASHSGSTDILSADIKTGEAFAIKLTRNAAYDMQIFAWYADGTNQKIATWSKSDHPYSKSLYRFIADKDIIGISQYAPTSANVRTCITELITNDSISSLIGYSKAGRTKPSIQIGSERLYFETGRARYDVNNIHQCIAIWNNQVWEFGEGKAAYNGVVYELENGHGNTCNWGITLHGNYPYLYCPTWTNNETKINVFTFDGTTFTLDHVINLDLAGYMDAYVDEFSERIYVFTYINNRSGVTTFTIADLSGNILSTKEIPYRIPVIQGMCLYNGVLYVTSGFATQEFPNYLNLISTDGALLGRYPMYNIGEIEGIGFMDNEMILASYYSFYIHPTRLPNPFRLSGIFDQLEVTT